MDNEKRYNLLKEINPREALLWKEACTTFPDTDLREYFKNYENFVSFKSKMHRFYPDEEVRFLNMLEICPELKEITKSPNTNEIEAWAIKVNF